METSLLDIFITISWFIIGFICSILTIIYYRKNVAKQKPAAVIWKVLFWMVMGTIAGLFTLGAYVRTITEKKK